MAKITLTLACFFLSFLLSAQTLGQLLSARYNFHIEPNSPKKAKAVHNLERQKWMHKDSILGMNGELLKVEQTDLGPVTDMSAEVYFLVSEQSPEFPGGQAAMNDYFQSTLSDIWAPPGAEVANTVYIQFTILENGRVKEVDFAQIPQQWIPLSTQQRCYEAIKGMPDWSPGLHGGHPVKVKMVMDIALNR